MPTTHKPYDSELIKSQLNSELPRNIYFLDEVDSTNSWLQQNGQCGDICISEKQTNGRGRQGNNWVSPANGNIYLSFCYCLSKDIQHWSLLGLVAGIAIVEALEDIGLKGHGIKWPNDIYWQRKKLGGVLIETSNQSEKLIIGIGLNMFLPDLKDDEINQQITSVKDAISGSHFSRNELLIKLIDRLSNHLENFENMDFLKFRQQWGKWEILHGERINFQHQGGVVSGKVADIDMHGRLGILDSVGKTRFYSSAVIKLDKKSIQQ